tara:strand:+ start:170 stop:370 length:201 start_codon:yes stop_codon:yes gene_type:complete
MAGIIVHGDDSQGPYMAHITVRQQVKGARRETHEYYGLNTEDLWLHVRDFLTEGFSVISVEMYTCE